MSGQPRSDRKTRSKHGSYLAGPFATTVVPVQLEAESVLHLRRARASKAPAADPHARIRGKAVDVVTREPRVGDGSETGLHREIDLRPPETAAHGGLTDTRDDGAAFQPVVFVPSVPSVPSVPRALGARGTHEASAFAGEKSGR
jgi:hypothetical protein